MELRSLAFSGGVLSLAALSPLVLSFALFGRPDVARGLLAGLVTSLLNSLLLARKIDRAIDGRDSWITLPRTMPRNLLLRLLVVLGVGAFAATTPGVSVVGMAAGLSIALIVGSLYSARALAMRWRTSDTVTAYEGGATVGS